MEKMTKLTNEELLRKVIKAAVELAIIRHSLTDEDVEERDDFDMEFVTADTANAAFGVDTCVEEPIPEVAEILQRMAEGAAGEAATQGDLLEVLKNVKKELQLSGNWEARDYGWPANRKAIDAAIAKLESGSASTAGPRPDVEGIIDRLNLVGQLLVAMDDLEPSDPMTDAIETAQCDLGSAIELLKRATQAGPRPKLEDVALKIHEAINERSNQLAASMPYSSYEPPSKEFSDNVQSDILGILSQFFAAAPAEDGHQCGTFPDYKPCAKCAPEDVQLDVEGLAREFIAANRPEPLKCQYCGEAVSSVPMASGFAQYCPKSKSGHMYMITVGTLGDSEEAEVKRLTSFAEALLRRVSGKGAQKI